MMPRIAVICNSGNPDLLRYAGLYTLAAKQLTSDVLFLQHNSGSGDLHHDGIASAYGTSSVWSKEWLVNGSKIRASVAKLRAFDPDVIHFTSAHSLNIVQERAIRKESLRIFSLHDPIPHPGPKGPLIRQYNRWLSRKADHLVFHSKWSSRQLSKEVPRTIFPLGGFKSDPQPLSVEARPPLLVFGRIQKYKGIGELARIYSSGVSRLPPIVVAGSGQTKLLERLRKHPSVDVIDRFIPSADLPVLFGRTLASLLPYSSATQSGVIPLSYSFSRPVISTRVGGLPEDVVQERTGIVMSSLDADNLCAAYDWICMHRKEMENFVLRKFESDHSEAAFIQAGMELYSKTIEKPL